MKRIVAVLLTAIILISCLPLTAVAAKTDTAQTAVGVEAKFRLLLEDLELKWYHDPDDYFYHELAQYPAKNPEWILLRAGLFQTDLPYEGFDYNYAVFGNKLIRANTHSAPFRLGYGVYDVKSGAFYDLIDAWDMNLNNLRDVWDGLAITDPYSRDDNGYETNMYVIGDADADGEVTILDATRIQRCIAELDENPWEDFAATGHDFIRGADIAGITDFDRDGDTTVMDATRIQRTIAELPSVIGYNLAWFYQDVTFSDTLYHEKYLVTDRSQLDPDYKDEKKMLDTYDDSFFNDHCLVGLNIPDTEAYDLKLTGVSLDTNGVLCIDLISKKREAIPAAPCHQCVCLELSNAFIDDIKDIKLNITAEEEPADIPIASVVNWKYPAAARPSDAEAAAQGYRMIDSESVFNGDYQASYGKNAVFDALTGERPYGSDVYYGYMAVIKTPAQFRYVFPERDASAYNEAFFKSNALIVLAHREGSYTNQIFLSHLAVKGDTLYSQMIFLDMRGEPMNNIFYDVQTVKLSDVKNVKQCALWDDPAYSRNYINSGDYTSGSAIPEKTDLPGSGYHKITAGSVERDVDYEYGGHFDNLKTATLVFNPYQYRYFVNDKAVPGGDEIMDDNAYLVFNFADKQNTARVNAVYSDGKTLDIFFRTEEKWSDNQIHRTRQSLRIKKSDITGIKEIRLYSGAPDTSLLYTAIPPVSQQTLIPENPWDQGYSKFYTWSIPMSAPSPYDYSAWSKFPCNIENGCVMLLCYQ